MTQPRFKGKYRIESIRLPNRDYAANGWYFVTICTQNRNHFFGNVIADQMQLSAIGIAQQFWAEIPNHFAHTYIDAYIIMPNHVHGIVVIDRPPILSSIATTPVETLHCNVSTPPRCNVNTQSNVNIQQRRVMSESPKTGSLGCIIRSYKSAVTRRCHQNGFDDFGWQSRFYEHIIRADGSLDRIRQYIINNPTKWAKDYNNRANLWM